MFAAALSLAVSAWLAPGRAHAELPPAGTASMRVTGSVSITSRLGAETIALEGTVEIQHGDPYLDGGVEVKDLEITELSLAGSSVTGPITVTLRSTNPSLGELRSLLSTESFPASSYLDMFIEVVVPASPGDTQTLHNNHALHLVSTREGEPDAFLWWPPHGFGYGGDPLTVSGTHCAQPGRSGLPLYPSQPSEVCVTSFSAELANAVGGVTELARPAGTDGAPGAPLLVALAAAAALAAGAAGLAARRAVR